MCGRNILIALCLVPSSALWTQEHGAGSAFNMPPAVQSSPLASPALAKPEIAWISFYDTTQSGGFYEPDAIALDRSGNVYVTGRAYISTLGSNDILTLKYNASGRIEWVRQYDGTGHGNDRAYGIAVDPAGNAYVAGESFGTTGGSDYIVVKYAPDGNPLWVTTYDGPGHSNDYAYAIALDSNNNVVVTGESVGQGTSTDFATLKLDSAGTIRWIARYDGPAHRTDRPCAIAFDAPGNIHVTGKTEDSLGHFDYLTIKYGADGAMRWMRRYDGAVHKDDEPASIGVDSRGNVYVTGWSVGIGSTGRHEIMFATVKYDSTGVPRWIAYYETDEYALYATTLAVDRAGNIFVGGYSISGLPEISSFITVKYNTYGTEQWVGRYNRTGSSCDVSRAMAVDSSGNVYVSGSTFRERQYSDMATVKYDARGNAEWTAIMDGPGPGDWSDPRIVCDANRNVYVTWMSRYQGRPLLATVKYLPKLASAAERMVDERKRDDFLIYPNPASGTSAIFFSLSAGGHATIDLRDTHGRIVRSIADGRYDAGRYILPLSSHGLPAGVYFCRLAAGSKVRICKLIIPG